MKSRTESRKLRLNIRASEADLEMYRDRAAQQGLSLTAWVRQTLYMAAVSPGWLVAGLKPPRAGKMPERREKV